MEDDNTADLAHPSTPPLPVSLAWGRERTERLQSVPLRLSFSPGLSCLVVQSQYVLYLDSKTRRTTGAPALVGGNVDRSAGLRCRGLQAPPLYTSPRSWLRGRPRRRSSALVALAVSALPARPHAFLPVPPHRSMTSPSVPPSPRHLPLPPPSVPPSPLTTHNPAFAKRRRPPSRHLAAFCGRCRRHSPTPLPPSLAFWRRTRRCRCRPPRPTRPCDRRCRRMAPLPAGSPSSLSAAAATAPPTPTVAATGCRRAGGRGRWEGAVEGEGSNGQVAADVGGGRGGAGGRADGRVAARGVVGRGRSGGGVCSLGEMVVELPVTQPSQVSVPAGLNPREPRRVRGSGWTGIGRWCNWGALRREGRLERHPSRLPLQRSLLWKTARKHLPPSQRQKKFVSLFDALLPSLQNRQSTVLYVSEKRYTEHSFLSPPRTFGPHA